MDGINSNPTQNHSQPDAMVPNNQASSEPLKGGKQRVKIGPGNQHCSTCGALGHNSKYFNHVHLCCQSTNSTIQGSNPHCPKKAIPNALAPIPDTPSAALSTMSVPTTTPSTYTNILQFS